MICHALSGLMKTLFRVFLGLVCLTMVAIILLVMVFRDRRPPIYFAAEIGDTNRIEFYLSSGGDVNHAIGYRRFGHWSAPLLDIAIENGHVDVVDFLLKKSANPNQPDSDGH